LVFVELCELLARPLPRFLERITIDGLEHVEAVMATHGRALALSAHLGNWELLSAAHRLSPYHLAVVIRPLDSPALNALADAVRNKTGVELIDKRRALRPVLSALGQGRIVGILPDQNALAVVAMATAAFGAPLDLSLDAYRVAAADGATGTVAGRAVDEADRRNSQDEPRVGIGVTLVPWSRTLLDELQEIKRRVRVKPATYPTSARSVVEARRTYERALNSAGAGDLVRYAP